MATDKVYWCTLFERAMEQHGVAALLRVADKCGQKGYSQIQTPYQRTDSARNNIVAKFLEVTSDKDGVAINPNDMLVMLDCDHIHPGDIVTQLTRHDPSLGVVAAQAHRRGEPFDMCAFIRVGETLHTVAEWEDGALLECAVAGTGAIMIRRWVLDLLSESGVKYPWFRYAYEEQTQSFPSEDVYFGLCCEHVGVSHWVDTSVKIPHLITSTVDETSWFDYMKDHPERVKRLEEVAVVEKQPTPRVPELKTMIGA